MLNQELYRPVYGHTRVRSFQSIALLLLTKYSTVVMLDFIYVIFSSIIAVVEWKLGMTWGETNIMCFLVYVW